MGEEIAVDLDQMLQNIQDLVKGIEGAGVGTRDTQVDAYLTDVTASYVSFSSKRLNNAELAITQLASQVAQFRDEVKGVLDDHAKTEGALTEQVHGMVAAVDDTGITTQSVMTDVKQTFKDRNTDYVLRDRAIDAGTYVAPVETDAPIPDQPTP